MTHLQNVSFPDNKLWRAVHVLRRCGILVEYFPYMDFLYSGTLIHEFVADTVNAPNELRPGWILFHFFPNMSDVAVDGPV
jgi:hypothetical protein